MSGLSGSLSIALSALMANQQALEATANNVANANTPGYTRERPVLVPRDPVTLDPWTFGTGVVLEKLESLRDPILDLRVSQATQDQGKLNTSLAALEQLQVMFSSNDSGIGAAISNLFDSFQQLSTDPTSPSLRQGVLTAAGDLATAFKTTAHNLGTQRINLDLNVRDTVNQINMLTSQIAAVNVQISSLENLHEEASTFIDQRTSLIQQLSSLVDVSTINTENGLALTTSNGTPLVTGANSFALTTSPGTDGMQHIMAQGRDITAQLTSGKLAGLIQVRDQTIPKILSDLDQLAGELATALNAAQQQGFDLNGDAGENLFVTPPQGNVGAAANLAVAITDPSLIAASSDGSEGSNGNIANLLAVHDNPIVNGQKPMDFYANVVFQVGSYTSNAAADLDAANQVLLQLQDQRNSVSGVSLDEEATNMIQYQTAYQAAARVIATIQNLLLDTVNLGVQTVQQ